MKSSRRQLFGILWAAVTTWWAGRRRAVTPDAVRKGWHYVPGSFHVPQMPAPFVVAPWPPTDPATLAELDRIANMWRIEPIERPLSMQAAALNNVDTAFATLQKACSAGVMENRAGGPPETL